MGAGGVLYFVVLGVPTKSFVSERTLPALGRGSLRRR